MIDGHFIRLLEDSAPLHDIGKAALPDHILNKPGPLDPQERVIMQDHTTIGAETLFSLVSKFLPLEHLSVEEVMEHAHTPTPRLPKLPRAIAPTLAALSGITLSTHDAGGITEKDLNFAASSDKLGSAQKAK